MRGKYLGDSYDLVKRVWAESLQPIAPLYAHPKFIAPAIRSRFTAVTLIRVLDLAARPEAPYGLFLDPHTGIPLPQESESAATASHASLQFIVQVNGSLRPAYMICFDQSYHRRHELTAADQRTQKRSFLQKHGISSFYYVSHASFLFMALNPALLSEVRRRLMGVGIPSDRFEAENATLNPPNRGLQPTACGCG